MASKCKRVRVDIKTGRQHRSFMAQRPTKAGGHCEPRWKHPTAKQKEHRREFKAAAKACNRVSRRPGRARSACMKKHLG